MSRDPVCGMNVEEHAARHTSEYRGEPYYFCGSFCKRSFDAEPQKYLEPDYEPSKPELAMAWLRDRFAAGLRLLRA